MAIKKILARSLKFLAQQFFIFASAVLISCLSAFAEEEVSNGDIINRIEKSLVFDKESREIIDFYKTDTSKKKSAASFDKLGKDQTKNSALIGNKPDEEEDDDDESLKITVVDPKKDSSDLREKEKMAYNYALIGQYEVSIQLLKAVLAQEPENQYASFALATIYQKVGQARQAKKIYYELLKKDVDNKEEVIFNLLNIIADESPREAIATTRRLILQNPQKDYLYNVAGQAYDKLGDYVNSEKMFDNAYDLNNKNIRYAYNLAVANDKLKNHQKAYDLYKKVVEKHEKQSDIPLEMVKNRLEQLKQIL